jgi:RHH-type rel operon transcriptional repressor/antitoxin RelB
MEREIMFSVRLPDPLERRLEHLSQQTGRSKSYYAKQALEEFLADKEDHLLACSRLEKKNPRISLEELEQRLGLAD